MTLRRPGICAGCSLELPAGARAAWDADRRTVHCLSCQDAAAAIGVDGAPVPSAVQAPHARRPADVGGASAQREYDKRSSRREQHVRARHPKLGGLLLALSQEPASTRVWAQGAAGERAVAAALDGLAAEHIAVLHDRRMRTAEGRLSRANIDHLAVAASGVWVIDAKTHQGALEVRRSGGLFSPRFESLFIGGRDQTKLVDGLLKQVDVVRAELSAVQADLPVHGALCFVGTELPWVGSRSITDVPLVGRRGLIKLLAAPGTLMVADRDAVADFLDRRFPPAA